MPTYIGSKKVKLYIGAKKIRQAYIGNRKIYSSGNIVTYQVDTGVTYQEEVDEGESCLSPKTFTPSKSGWIFVGWRADSTANGTVLTSKVMGDATVTLYAVFTQAITVSYNGNGSTSGSTVAQTGQRYYNNGNVTNPSFMLRDNGFARSGATFVYWAMGNVSGTTYKVGAAVTLSANTTLYAKWQLPDATIAMGTVFPERDSVTHYLETGFSTVANKVLYTIDGSKYRGFALTVNQTTMVCYNNTIGLVNTNFSINGKTIRGALTGNSSQSGTGGDERSYTGALSYGGKSFTLTVDNASSIYWSGNMGRLDMSSGSIKLLGAIV